MFGYVEGKTIALVTGRFSQMEGRRDQNPNRHTDPRAYTILPFNDLREGFHEDVSLE